MNTQKNIIMSNATRTLVGISMMALAMVSFTACGKKSDSDTTGTSVSDPNGTATTGGTTTPSINPNDPNATVGNTNTTGGAGVTGNANGTMVNLAYAVLEIDPNAATPAKMYTINFLSYNPVCFYTQNVDPTYSTYPNSFNAMAVHLTNGGVAPTAGTYTVGGAAMAIDATSGFEAVTACVAPSSTLAAGSTVTLNAIDTTAKTASGTVTVTLSNGGTLTGSFTTTATCDVPATTPATMPLCTDTAGSTSPLTISYK